MEKSKLIFQERIDAEGLLYEWASLEGLTDDTFFVKKINSEYSKTTIFIFEEYYFRISSNLSLTFIINETSNETAIDIISSGGTSGLLGISYGAEENAVNRIVQLFRDNGFIEQ